MWQREIRRDMTRMCRIGVVSVLNVVRIGDVTITLGGSIIVIQVVRGVIACVGNIWARVVRKKAIVRVVGVWLHCVVIISIEGRHLVTCVHIVFGSVHMISLSFILTFGIVRRIFGVVMYVMRAVG
jgi:hypothetical protein